MTPAKSQLRAAVINYDNEGDPVVCLNRRYRGAKYISPRQLCGGCEFEVGDLFHGTTNDTAFYGWYCAFGRKAGR